MWVFVIIGLFVAPFWTVAILVGLVVIELLLDAAGNCKPKNMAVSSRKAMLRDAMKKDVADRAALKDSFENDTCREFKAFRG